MIFKSLTTRVIVISITLLTFGISAFTFLNLQKEQTQLINSARESTEILLNTIEGSIYNSMRIGNTEDTQTILEMVGSGHKLLSVRIFHPHGVVLKSSRPAEVGKAVDTEDYQLYVNNKREGIFTGGSQGETLKMLKPIYNDVPCYPCHGNKTKVIGVLNVNYSLLETRKRVVEATNIFIISTVAIIIFLSGAISLVMLKFVRKPLYQIVGNMAKVEKGDLSVRMKATGKDEVGRLIVSFNSMVDRLDTAKKELDQYHFQQMERADRLASVGEMAAGIAHEIKNPLTGIAAAMTIIKEDFAPSDPRTEIVNEILEQIKRLDKTVNDLLFFGKPTQPEPTCINVNTILNAVGQRMADNQGVFERNCSAGPVPTSTTRIATGAGNYDLGPCVIPDYISTLPVDPGGNGAHFLSVTDYDTGYDIIKDETSARITISAPFAELSSTIAITR